MMCTILKYIVKNIIDNKKYVFGVSRYIGRIYLIKLEDNNTLIISIVIV